MSSCVNSHFLRWFATAVLVCCLASVTRATRAGAYDPSLGTLPSDQGWSAFGVAPAPPFDPPYIIDGTLHQGLTPFVGEQGWRRTDVITDFNLPGGFDIVLSSKTLQSTYGPGGFPASWRTGFYVMFRDSNSISVNLGIASDGIRIANDYNGLNANSSAFYSFDTTSSFHDYRVNVSSAGIRLSIDDVSIPSASIPLGAPTGFSNEFEFGDRSNGGASEMLIKSLTWNAAPLIAVSSVDDRKVLEFDSAGGFKEVANVSNGLFAPVGLASDGHQSYLLGDTLRSRISRIASDGTVSVFSQAPNGPVTPTGLAVDPQGNILVADYLAGKLSSYDHLGNETVVATALQGLGRPIDVAVETLSNFLIADVDGRRVLRVNGLGQWSVFADASDGLFSPVSVAVDSQGRVYVADALFSRIFRFDANGNGSVFADSTDGLVSPTGLTFDTSGNLYVANYLGNNILRFNEAGQSQVFANVHRPWDVTGMGSSITMSRERLNVASVPEPSTCFLLLSAIASLVATTRVWRLRGTRS